MSGDPVEPEKAAKVVPDGQSEAPKKRKKKNAPDRPQPAWLFPPDEENPILNPKPVDEARRRRDEEERQQSIKFLKHKAVTAPMKPAPPTKLLTLVGAFLSSYGFNSTCRIFTVERNARKKLDGWEDEIGEKLDKGTPDLVKIYKEWFREWQERRELEMTSSDDDDDAVTKRAKMVKKKLKLEEGKANDAENTSSSGSDSSSDDDEGEATKVNGVTTSKVSGNKAKAAAKSSASSSASSSDSDADNEKGALAAKASSTKSTVGSLVNKLKRKSSESSSSASSSDASSESESDSDSDASAPAKKKKKKLNGVKEPTKATDALVPPKANVTEKISKVSVEAPKKSKKSIERSAPAKSKSSSSSSGASSSSSESDARAAAKSKSKSGAELKVPDQPNSADRKTSTDSSATLNVTAAKKVTSASGSSPTSSSTSVSSSPGPTAVPLPVSSPAAVKKEPAPKKRKRSQSPDAKPKAAKKNNTPFSRIPQDVKIDEKLASNAYVPYDYAEKAHQDLIVTKGKNFTKEKNKKKKGA
ncbi:MAG: hypothetical protein Q9187_005431 [Circinaria calcarea]